MGNISNTEPGSTMVSISSNSITYNLTPLSIYPDSLKVMIYNHFNPYSVLNIPSFRIGIRSESVKWSDLYINIVPSWTRVKDLPAQARYKSTGFSLAGNCYVAGGAGYGTVYSDFWKYVVDEDYWTKLNDVPSPARVYPRSFSNASFGFVGAGFTTENTSKIQLYDFYKYDPQTGTWTSLPDYPDQILNFYVGYTVSVNNVPFVSLSTKMQLWRK